MLNPIIMKFKLIINDRIKEINRKIKNQPTKINYTTCMVGMGKRKNLQGSSWQGGSFIGGLGAGEGERRGGKLNLN